MCGVFLLVTHAPRCVQAQSRAFDPLSDPKCEVVQPEKTTAWASSYMWYPGQLSAHMQVVQKRKSEARCVNVGYPGKFNRPASATFFRRTVKLHAQAAMEWVGPGSITCSVDGHTVDGEKRRHTLPPGKHTVLFEVSSGDRLPCLMVGGGVLSETDGWEVSLDKQDWLPVETDARYNKSAVFPDDEQEIVTLIHPDSYALLRNASAQGGQLTLGKNAGLVADFRHLEVGQVKLQAKGTGILSFYVGESPEETLNDSLKHFEQRPIPPVALTGDVQEIVLPERALRYLRITSTQACTLSALCLHAKVWPVDFQMQFACSDPHLNDLWNAGVATLHTSLHNFYLDGVKRDYLPWSMDAIVSALAGDYLFGDRQVSRNGLSIALMPPHPASSDWGIVDYPLHALIGFKHDYLRYGDLKTSLLFKDRIVQMLALYDSVQDVRGFISDRYSTSGFIPGWATKMGPEGKGIPAYAQIMLYQNYRIGAYFARLWKESALAKRYEAKAGFLRTQIKKHFWDEGRKAFINGYTADGQKDRRISHHAQYWAVLADLYPPQDYDYLFDVVIPHIPYYTEDISYEKGYEFLAYAKAGRISDMFALLDEVWGDWLRQGYTRFPENFSPKARLPEQLVFYHRPFGLSLCHGGNGAPPVVAVLHGLFGFSQSDEHPSSYSLRPELLHLDWIKGRIPLKEGYLNLELRKDGTGSIEIPDHCTVSLTLKGKSSPLVWKKGGRYELPCD